MPLLDYLFRKHVASGLFLPFAPEDIVCRSEVSL